MANKCVFKKIELWNYKVVMGENGKKLESAGMVTVPKCQHMYRAGRPFIADANVGDELPEAFGIDCEVPGARENHPVLVAGS